MVNITESVQEFVEQQERGVFLPFLLKHLRMKRNLANITRSEPASRGSPSLAIATNAVQSSRISSQPSERHILQPTKILIGQFRNRGHDGEHPAAQAVEVAGSRIFLCRIRLRRCEHNLQTPLTGWQFDSHQDYAGVASLQ